MTCSAPCGHQFCWLCLGPWDEHRNNYSCNRYSQEKAKGTLIEANARRKQAKASLDRYLHYYERWTANGASRKKAREDLDDLVEGNGLDAFAATMGVPSSKQIDFLGDAYAQIVESRRVLRWTYAYVYFLEQERDKAKRDFFEYLQSEAEASLERLHHCAEREREALCDAASAAAAAASAAKFAEYRITLVNLTGVTQNYFNQLVKGFETGMAEVLV
ncbi:probable E3 ubiquitin-protein ligase ARI7 [Phragmites australis]|uniref:probable E3 ubiquitin-protein ligase ARI7 n=1 Tax=Phragmites australis TaxID=29695 RepID=UPI002D76511B|nr:probable E3 ubiquitin-protein ligase ARI7 [Phragmites australis]